MRVHGSQTYRKMDVTRERISRILELREILPSFQTGFSLVNAAVVCATLESISKPEILSREFSSVQHKLARDLKNESELCACGFVNCFS